MRLPPHAGAPPGRHRECRGDVSRLAANMEGVGSEPLPSLPPNVGHRIALVQTARLLFGASSARQLWDDLGLPTITGRSRSSSASGSALHFVGSALDFDGLSEVQGPQLYCRYLQWAEQRSIKPTSPSGFGRMLARAGVENRKSNGVTIYCGVRLREPGQ